MIISIIICTRNRAAALAETLAALQQVEIPQGDTAELVLVDNGSTDATASVVRGFSWSRGPVRIAEEPRQGKGFAYNRGVAASKGDVIVLTDDDVRAPVRWLAEVVEPIRAGDADVVAGGVAFPPHLMRSWMTPKLRAVLSSTETLDAARPEWVVAANLAFRRDVVSRVPAFDAELGPGALGLEDEVLFAGQAEVAGFRVKGAFGAPVEHWFDASRLSRAGLLAYARAGGRSKAYTAHHWHHVEHRMPARRRFTAALNLVLYRLLHPLELLRSEGMSENELELVRSLGFWEQYLIERQRPRAYEKHGLVKRAQDS